MPKILAFSSVPVIAEIAEITKQPTTAEAEAEIQRLEKEVRGLGIAPVCNAMDFVPFLAVYGALVNESLAVLPRERSLSILSSKLVCVNVSPVLSLAVLMLSTAAC